MRIIKRDIRLQNSFHLPIHPHCLIESNCPKCGALAFPNSDVRNAVINFGNHSLPSKLHFTCFNYLSPERCCEHSWTEQVIISVSLEAVPSTSVRCPCCHYKTLTEAASYEICPVCYWEDDGQGDGDVAEVKGGPNRDLSLQTARQNYFDFKACDTKYRSLVRAPKPEEL